MRFTWLVLAAMSLVLVVSGCRNKPIETGEEDLLGDPGVFGAEMLPTDVFQGVEPFDQNPDLQRVEGLDLIPVQFGYDSFQVAPREMPKIEQVAGYMNENSDYKLVVEGHCDERGSREYNLSLGDRRAQSVRSYLISLGIDSMRVQTRSFGEEKPVDPGHNEAAWRLNRRGEFILYR